MSETLIARTYAEGLRPLGAASQRNHALVSETVAARFSPAHALLFSEPSPTPDGVAVDWYAQTEGPVRRLNELDSEEQDKMRTHIAELKDDIEQYARELRDTGRKADCQLAEALEHALEIPGGEDIWLVGDQPVLANWAHSRDIDKAPRGVIRRLKPARPQPPKAISAAAPAPTHIVAAPSIPAKAARRTPLDILWWLGWLVLALLMAWLLYLLIAPCELRGPAFLRFGSCPGSSLPAAETEIARQAAFEQRIAALQRELATAGSACATRPPPIPEPEPVAQAPEPVVQTVVEEGGRIGKLNFILSWEGRSDIDLAVRCPSGSVISYRRKTACGGKLDVDANAGYATMREPVENVTFAERPAPGPYGVKVTLFRAKDVPPGGSHPFSLLIIDDGRETMHRGMVRSGDPWTMTFIYGDGQ